MHEAYSPDKKVQILLKVCKSIYHSMSANATRTVFGADDFLPCLTWVLLRSDVVTLQVDTDYMMELLDPTQLQGEGGYYLTTIYASLYYISSFQPRLPARQLSVEAQHSLNQWHRRRTLHCEQSRRSKHRRTIRRQACQERDRSLHVIVQAHCFQKHCTAVKVKYYFCVRCKKFRLGVLLHKSKYHNKCTPIDTNLRLNKFITKQSTLEKF
uniref:VPS9 domain-containing protein n=1 Tax=Monopterus albus TaxID=43700 RepID=A0A3Q3R9K4_MONAL